MIIVLAAINLILFGVWAFVMGKGRKLPALITGLLCLVANTWLVATFLTVSLGYGRDWEKNR